MLKLEQTAVQGSQQTVDRLCGEVLLIVGSKQLFANASAIMSDERLAKVCNYS